MEFEQFEEKRTFVVRLETGEEWRQTIEEFADKKEIDAAWYNGLGAVKDAEIYFYDQTEKEYMSIEFDEPFEVAASLGNISWLDKERFAHTHALLTRDDGTTVGGHLNRATVFAGELFIKELDGKISREHDKTTDLDVWSNYIK